jgi:subtilisin family serine protease
MKCAILILLLLFFIREADSQSSYYYNGNRVNLDIRTDKVAIVLNSGGLTSELKERIISDAISDNADLKEIYNNIYLLTFRTGKSVSEVQDITSMVSAINPIIKFATPVYYGQSENVSQIPTDEFIVRLNGTADKSFLEILNLRNNVSIIGNVSDERGFLLKSNDGVRMNALELCKTYFSSGLFEYAEPNFVYPEFCILNSIPNDPLFPKQWSLKNTGQLVPTGSSLYGDVANVNGLPGADMNVDRAWDITTGSSLIKIGVFDTGIDSTHPDFRQAGHLLTGYDAFFNKYGVPKDSGNFGGHGTCAAGLAGAVSNNGIGTAGVAPGCKLMSFRIFNMTGSSTTIGIARAFDTARVIGIDVLSNSWNGFTETSTVTDAINNAAMNGRGGLGCVILFSAGNDGRRAPWYPSYLPNVISVGASTNFDQKKAPGTGNQFSWGGNYGENGQGDLDLVAPTICYTTDIQGAFGYNNNPGTDGDFFASFSGTSVSCPNTAGIAALILSVNPSLTRTAVMEYLFRGCDKIDNADYSIVKSYGKWNPYLGYGRVNAYNSVQLALGNDVTPPTIDHKNISSHSSTYPKSIIARITDQDGSSVPLSGDYRPKLFYRLNKMNGGWSAFDSLNADTFSSGNEFTFTLPGMGHETQVQYFIKAFDNAGNISVFPRGAPNDFWLCYFAVGSLVTKSRTIGSFACLDGGNVTVSPEVIFDNFNITDTKVQIYMQHERMRDVIIQLYAPLNNSNRNRKCLFASNGANGANILGATVSDSASQFWMDGTPPYAGGSFKGDYFLNGLNGTNALGPWKIMHYDQFLGFAGAYDSVVIALTGTSGISSSCAVKNSERDSVLEFGAVNFPDSITKDFYLKNAGTSELIINGVTFTGTFGTNFSLNDSLPGPIQPGDSGRISVKLRTVPQDNSNTGNSITDAIEDAVMEISNNDPSKSIFKVSLQTDLGFPVVNILGLRALIQGFYNASTDSMKGDTVKVFARDVSAPFAVLDSAKGYLNESGSGFFVFTNLVDSIPFQLQIIHRNSLETWSGGPQLIFSGDTLLYDMTDQSPRAFGDNLVLVNSNLSRYAIYSGDVNEDGIIDITDLMIIDNDVYNYATGYLPTDINGDGFVDLTDAVIAGNNAENYIAKIVP